MENGRICPVCGTDCRNNPEYEDFDITNEAVYANKLDENEVYEIKNYLNDHDWCGGQGGPDIDLDNIKEIREAYDSGDEEEIEDAIGNSSEVVYCNKFAYLLDDGENTRREELKEFVYSLTK